MSRYDAPHDYVCMTLRRPVTQVTDDPLPVSAAPAAAALDDGGPDPDARRRHVGGHALAAARQRGRLLQRQQAKT